MCQFFSFLSNGKGKFFYIKPEERQEVWDSKDNPDSHSYIVFHHQQKGELAIGNEVEDRLNKYEYVITRNGWEFIADQINTTDDRDKAKSWVQKLFKNPDPLFFDSENACLYCRYVKDIKEMRNRITDSYYAYWYCLHVKDIKEMRDKITNSYAALWYCVEVKDRKEVREKITNPTNKESYKLWKGEQNE